MTHVFVAPHPDDVALSCGGLIASLREVGQTVTIITVFSGQDVRGAVGPSGVPMSEREALGFGNKTMWPSTEAFNRSSILSDYPIVPAWAADDEKLESTQADADAAAKRFWQRSSWYRRANIHNESLAGQAVIDDLPTQGAVLTSERLDAADAGDLLAARRLEDERYAAFSEVSMVWLDLPDAVYRGYQGDDQLLGEPRLGDEAPVDIVRREIARLEPQRVYMPLAVGGHVDHRLARDAGTALLHDARRWVMPGPEYVGQIAYYEDFPYAWWDDFTRIEELPGGVIPGLPEGVSVAPEFADISDQVERKIRGIAIYESQLGRLFSDRKAMANAVRSHATRIADLGRVPNGAAERYWVTTRA
jgi:LmbE family N-acetylglucosaminyl deacetylase